MNIRNEFTIDDMRNMTMGDGFFIKSLKIKVHRFSDSLRVTDLEDAMRKGKKCREATVNPTSYISRGNFWPNLLNSIPKDWDFERLIHEILKGNFVSEDVDTSVREVDSKRTYSPWATLNPLKEPPKKWTVAHVVRALVNNQVKEARIDGIYTDDYASDYASDYQRGDFDTLKFTERLVESPSGWWLHEEKTVGTLHTISINCYQFDNRTIVIDTNIQVAK